MAGPGVMGNSDLAQMPVEPNPRRVDEAADVGGSKSLASLSFKHRL